MESASYDRLAQWIVSWTIITKLVNPVQCVAFILILPGDSSVDDGFIDDGFIAPHTTVRRAAHRSIDLRIDQLFRRLATLKHGTIQQQQRPAPHWISEVRHITWPVDVCFLRLIASNQHIATSSKRAYNCADNIGYMVLSPSVRLSHLVVSSLNSSFGLLNMRLDTRQWQLVAYASSGCKQD